MSNDVQPAHAQTPSQTIGPFFHTQLMRDVVDNLDPAGTAGDPIIISGQVLDGAGEPITDAMVEIWQPDGWGRHRHPADERSKEIPGAFIGFGRVASDAKGFYEVRTVMPGPVAGRGGTIQAPHLNLQIFPRGLLDKLVTRIYFSNQPGNDADPVLASVPVDRRHTLIAADEGHRDGAQRFRFDIVFQGLDETVFFDA